MADLSGRILGGCRLVRPIGAGGMGEVYLAEQMRLGDRPVAVKVIRLDDSALTPDALQDVERRFKDEAQLLAKFSHPNILAVYDAGVEDGELYLVMEYVPGGSLADAIRKGPNQRFPLPLDPALAVNLVGQVAAALQYTHDRGVVHRDVKPGNILLRALDNGSWQALLADFGVARAMSAQSQRTQVTGTFAYMAPEQFGGTFSPASDQYALGIVAYLLLVGRPPFEGDLATVSQGHLNQPPPSLRAFNPAITPAVDVVVRRALAKQPGDRYPSVAAFGQALREALAAPANVTAPRVEEVADVTKPGRQQEDGPAPWLLPGERPAGRRQPGQGLNRAWLAVIAAVVLLAGALGGAGLLRQRQQQVSAQQTQTAGAQATNGVANVATANANATVTATAGIAVTATDVAATATAAVAFPTATATYGPSSDVTSPPPAPSEAFQLVFADAAPTCHGAVPAWITDNGTQKSCPANGGVEVVATTANTLGCIEQQANIPADAYISALVTPKNSGLPSILFREGITAQDKGTGYVFQADQTNVNFLVLRLDPNATPDSPTIGNGSLQGQPAADFALGVLVQGHGITVYVNGHRLNDTPIADSTYTSGWLSLCTTGDAVFRDVQVYNLKSSVG